jgi:hypothetical protein
VSDHMGLKPGGVIAETDERFLRRELSEHVPGCFNLIDTLRLG